MTDDPIARDVQDLCCLVDRLTTEVIVAWSYVDPNERRTDRADQLVRQANEIVTRLRAGMPPPPELTDAEKQRAHETLVAALNRREWRNTLTPPDIGMVPVRRDELGGWMLWRERTMTDDR